MIMVNMLPDWVYACQSMWAFTATLLHGMRTFLCAACCMCDTAQAHTNGIVSLTVSFVRELLLKAQYFALLFLSQLPRFPVFNMVQLEVLPAGVAESDDSTLAELVVACRVGKVTVTHLATGDYEVQDVRCCKCSTSLGWTYLKAFNEV